ncbi:MULTISPECIES: LysR family transcriptional regulator [unclassified Meridianimarinicoccus]|uniref:LysR family transcriptional regulator n=1 Tax=unclassified Meridianimarinicoccus TaxID=2923344 RepID=UPI0018677284|nr:LysR family transcriptional regulator [Fluviibacterium sp. MJW13]
MQPDDLMVFLMVARRGSITAAAQHLGKDAATVGRRVARLENDLGETLFAKSPKGYHLTEAGHGLLPKAETMEELVTDIKGGFRQVGRHIDGKIRIGAPDGCATFLLPQVCARLTRDNPGLVIEVVATARETDLLGREVDLAVTLSPPTAKAVEHLHLADYELHLAMARRLAGTVADPLRDLPVISYIPEHLIDPALDIPDDLISGQRVLRSNSVLVQWQWLRQGAGLGLVHDFTLRQDPGLMRVKPDFTIHRSYYLASRRADNRFDRMRRFRSMLLRQVAQEISRPSVQPAD